MINAYLGSNADEVVVLINEETYLLPVRLLPNGVVYGTTIIPGWWRTYWEWQKTAMKEAGFSMRKTGGKWRIEWRNRRDELDKVSGLPAEALKPDFEQDWYQELLDEYDAPTSEQPTGSGNTSAESDFHAWLREVDASLPLPTPEDMELAEYRAWTNELLTQAQ